MPRTAKYHFFEDATTATFDVTVPGIKANQVDIVVADLYLKVNHPPDFFEVDLTAAIDPDHEKTSVRVTAGGVKLVLKKREDGIWQEYKAKGEKSELRARRAKCLEEHQVNLEKKKEAKKDHALHKQKAAERDMWAKDRANKNKVEGWKESEKKRATEEVFGAFDDGPERKALADSASSSSMLDRLREGDGREVQPVVQAAQRASVSESESGATSIAPSSPTISRKSSMKSCLSKSGSMPGRRRSVGWADTESEGRQSLVEKFDAPQNHSFSPPPRSSSFISSPGSTNAVARSESELAKSNDIFTDEAIEEKAQEEIVEVRKGPAKIGLTFSERAMPGVPARDRPDREPPKPKGKVEEKFGEQNFRVLRARCKFWLTLRW